MHITQLQQLVRLPKSDLSENAFLKADWCHMYMCKTLALFVCRPAHFCLVMRDWPLHQPSSSSAGTD